MSTYRPHKPMSMDVLELRSRVKVLSGLHMNFPYGIRLPNPPGTIYNSGRIPPLYEGLTVRGFYYAPDNSPTESILELYNASHGYYAGTKVVGQKLIFVYSGKGFGSQGEFLTSAKVAVPGYYSVAVRMFDVGHLSIHHLYDGHGKVFVGKVNDYAWNLRFQGGAHHFLLSLHISAENDIAPRILGQSLYLEYPWFALVSYWLIDCFVDDARKPCGKHCSRYGEKKMRRPWLWQRRLLRRSFVSPLPIQPRPKKNVVGCARTFERTVSPSLLCAFRESLF